VDANTTIVLVAVITLVGSLGGSFMANRLQIRREKEQERKEHERWVREEKKRIYVSLMDAMMRLTFSGIFKSPVTKDDIMDLSRHFSQLNVFGTDQYARELMEDFGKNVIGSIGESGLVGNESLTRFHTKLRDTARKDLGT